ncbi:hypothetical protein EYF80_026669 [Liparis tanakae]|uniref:Ig-like domain-containing protein n=1 Tax=Liparis tanakae TaxID=230148 RepID=A0A4Z2HDF3_9TELE|nr:hypothetical protein EYF80_026669 [Liparis tanakae]
MNVSVMEGQIFDFRCEYENGQQNNTKYFCYDKDENDDNMCSVYLIQTQKHDQWHEDGRFSLYDNTTGAFFIVRGENLTSGDGGTYRCGVEVDHVRFMDLNVSRELHLSLFVTAAMFTSAVLFICLFTLCLRLAVHRRRPGPRQNREVGLNSQPHSSSKATAMSVGRPTGIKT